jgi:hypothetical protein
VSSSTSTAPVSVPRVLDASVDDYVSRVLSQIPADKTGIVDLDVSNAGAVLSAVARKGRLSGVAFVGFERGRGTVFGGRGRFVF